jgi:hypothetical protein
VVEDNHRLAGLEKSRPALFPTSTSKPKSSTKELKMSNEVTNRCVSFSGGGVMGNIVRPVPSDDEPSDTNKPTKRLGRWFRFYDDALNDPKVLDLPDDLFRFWVKVLCVASQHNGKLPDNKALTHLLRGRCDHVVRRMKELMTRGLIDNVGGVLEPHNWEKRQYKSDLSTPRVREHRDQMKRFKDVS